MVELNLAASRTENPAAPPMLASQSIRNPLALVFIALIAIYATALWLRPTNVFWSLDEGGKFLYIQNIEATGSTDIQLSYPGRELDPDLQHVPLYFWHREGDEVQTWWPVGFSLLTFPFYYLLDWAGLFVLPIVSGGLIGVQVGLLVHYLYPANRAYAVGAALITGLATPVFFYSTVFWEHSPSVALFLGAICALAAAERQPARKWLILCGVLASLATFVRLEQLFVSAGLIAFLLLRRWRWSLWVGIPFVATTMLWLAANYWIMGNILATQWGPGNSRLNLATGLFWGVRDAGIWFVPYILFNAPMIIAFALDKWILALGTFCTLLCCVLPFKRAWHKFLVIPYAGLLLLCSWVLFQPYGYRSIHGFVLIAPHTVFAVWLFRGRWLDKNACQEVRSSLLPGVLLTGICIFALNYVTRSWVGAGGQQWGPRYMTILYPMLVIMSVCGLAHLRTILPRLIPISYVVLLLVGIGFQIRGQQVILQTTGNYAATQQALTQMDQSPILTECTWLPMVIPELYWEGRIFAQGGQTGEAWLAQLTAYNITTAYTLQMDMCLVEPLDKIGRLRQENSTGIQIVEIGNVRNRN